MATGTEVLQIIDRVLAEEAAAYGIQNPAAFADALFGVITSENAGYDPTMRHGGGEYGLFGFYPGPGYHEEAFRNAYPGQEASIEAQVRYALTYLAGIWRNVEEQGQTSEQGLYRLIDEGQRPAEEYVEQGYQNALAAMRSVSSGGGTMPNGTIDTAGVAVSPWERDMGVGAAPPTPTGQGATVEFAQWLVESGFGGYVYQAEDGSLLIHTNPPASVVNRFLDETGGTSALTPEEQEQQRLKTAGEEIDLGLWPYSITTDEFDNTRQYYLDLVATDQMGHKEAISRFNAWLAGAQEASSRAETLMEREQRTLPSQYFPLTEPGGMLSQIAEGYGLPWTPWKGVPIEEMTSPQNAFRYFQEDMGLSQQAPEMAPYDSGPVMEQYGQAVGAQSQGAQAAIDWIRGMLQKRGIPST